LKSSCLRLLNAEITGVHHHFQHSFFLKTGKHLVAKGMKAQVLGSSVPFVGELYVSPS
jgi:hypothetical protein